MRSTTRARALQGTWGVALALCAGVGCSSGPASSSNVGASPGAAASAPDSGSVPPSAPPFSAGPPSAGPPSSQPPEVDAGGPIGFTGASGKQPIYHATTSQTVPPPPISGGTLAISNDGAYAFAADSDRDAFYVVDLKAETSATVALTAGDEPGRVVEDAAGNVHVALRGGGAVATIDPATKTLVGRTSVCARPRGIAYMASTDSLYVACAGGELVTLPAAGGAPTRTTFVEADLRDVVVVGSSLYVSELRSAAILQIAPDGSIANRFARPTSELVPGVAWRMIGTPAGLAVSLQQASTAPISPTPGSYGTGGCGGAVTNPAIGTWSLDGTSQGLSTLEGVLPVDLAPLARRQHVRGRRRRRVAPARVASARHGARREPPHRRRRGPPDVRKPDLDQRAGDRRRVRFDGADPRPDARARAARPRRAGGISDDRVALLDLA